MSKSRREFLTQMSIGLFGVSAGFQVQEQKPLPGAPPAFGTSSPVGPEVSPGTFAEAEKLVRVEMTASNRDEAAGNWRKSMAALYERRTGPRKVSLQRELSPATVWDPVLPGAKAGPKRAAKRAANPATKRSAPAKRRAAAPAAKRARAKPAARGRKRR